jgi:hypothetical protein
MPGAGAFALHKQSMESPRRAAGSAQPVTSDGVARGETVA